MRLDIRVMINGEKQTSKLRLHPMDSRGKGNCLVWWLIGEEETGK